MIYNSHRILKRWKKDEKFIDKICDILFRPKKTSLFWLYFVCGVLLVLLGIMLMPVWSGAPDWVFWRTWGYNCVDLIICACIVLYLGLFLFKKSRAVQMVLLRY